MQRTNDLLYCCSPGCKQHKIIKSMESLFNEHMGHVFKWTSKLRIELQETKINFNQSRITKYYDELMQKSQICINSLKETFSEAIQILETQIDSFVTENVNSFKKYQLIYQAVMDNNMDLIIEHQNDIDLLKRDQKYFEEQEQSSINLPHQLYKLQESTIKIIKDIKIIFRCTPESQVTKPTNFPKPQTIEVIQDFKWSKEALDQSFRVEGKLVRKEKGGLFSIVLEPRLNFKLRKSVKLKVIEGSNSFIYICDLNVVKNTYHVPEKMRLAVYGAYSHRNNGCIYGPDCALRTTKSFSFQQGDTLELRWDGPNKTFTTINISTGEKFNPYKINNLDSNLALILTYLLKYILE